MNDVIYNPIIPNDPDDPNDLAEAVETRNAKNMQPRNVNPGTQFHTKQGVNNSCNNFVVPMTSPSISPPQNTVIQSAKSSFIYIHMNNMYMNTEILKGMVSSTWNSYFEEEISPQHCKNNKFEKISNGCIILTSRRVETDQATGTVRYLIVLQIISATGEIFWTTIQQEQLCSDTLKELLKTFKVNILKPKYMPYILEFITEYLKVVQTEILVSGETHRLYCLITDKLFRPGQVWVQPDMFGTSKPGIMIPIGKSRDTMIFYSLKDSIGTQNPHMFVKGRSGSGKSFFMRKFAKHANIQGIPVISIGTESACLKCEEPNDIINVTESDLYDESYRFKTILDPIMDKLFNESRELALTLIDEDEQFSSSDECISSLLSLIGGEKGSDELTQRIREADMFGIYSVPSFWNRTCVPGKSSTIIIEDEFSMDRALSSFYDYKSSQKRITQCVLIIDECQEYDLSQNSVIVKKLLRQGRKYGIIVCLVSQYLTAGDARNIDKALRQCETKIVFQPEDDAETAKFLSWRTSDHDKRDALRDVGKYACAACGNISTSRCMLDYPVFISIPDDR